MPQVAAAVEALDPVHVARAMADGGEVGIAIDGDEHTLGPEELTLALQPLEGYEVEAEAGHAVALQLELDDGAAPRGPCPRDRPRRPERPQRRRAWRSPTGSSLPSAAIEELIAAAREHEHYMAGEVLATSVAYDAAEGTAAKIDGRDLRIDLNRA